MSSDSPLAHLVSAITARAHHMWESLGKPDGKDVDIWLAAEKAIHAEHFGKGDAPVHINNIESFVPAVESEMSDINPSHNRSATSFDVIH